MSKKLECQETEAEHIVSLPMLPKPVLRRSSICLSMDEKLSSDIFAFNSKLLQRPCSDIIRDTFTLETRENLSPPKHFSSEFLESNLILKELKVHLPRTRTIARKKVGFQSPLKNMEKCRDKGREVISPELPKP